MSLVVSFSAGEVPVGVREALSDFFPGSSSRFGGLEAFFLKLLEVEVVDNKSGGNDVILINIFNKWLHTGFLDELLFIDSSLDIPGVAGNSNNQQMWESMFLRISASSTLVPSS